MTKIMVRTYVVVRHSGQNWYWECSSAVCWAYSLRAHRQADNVKKNVLPLLDYGDTFHSLGAYANCQNGDKKHENNDKGMPA